jgi:hypothetical protein
MVIRDLLFLKVKYKEWAICHKVTIQSNNMGLIVSKVNHARLISAMTTHLLSMLPLLSSLDICPMFRVAIVIIAVIAKQLEPIYWDSADVGVNKPSFTGNFHNIKGLRLS